MKISKSQKHWKIDGLLATVYIEKQMMILKWMFLLANDYEKNGVSGRHRGNDSTSVAGLSHTS